MKNSILGSIMLFGLLAAPSGAYANTKSDPLPIGLHGKGASVSAMTRSSEAWQSTEKSLPVMASSSGTVFYGNVIFADSWNSLGEWDVVPYGIYSFEAVPNFTVSSVFEDEDYLSASAGVYAYGSYYSFVTRSLFGEFYGVRVYKLDPETWESENGMMGIMDYEDYSGLPLSMTYDVKGEIAYALMHNEDASGFYWATMDEYGDFTKLADWADPDNTMVALACNKSGQIYGIAEDGNLYTIDKQTGTPSLVGSTGQKPSYLQSAAYDYRSGKIVWAACLESQETKLFEVDPATGTAELIGDMPDREQMVGLYCIMPPVAEGAPAAVADLKVDFVGAGLDGTISFTIPTVTFGDLPLTGEVNVSVLVDGVEIKTDTKNPGEQCSYVYAFAEGSHEVSVVLSNAEGEGDAAYCSVFAGTDIPAAVTDLSLSVSDDGTATLTWKAPQKGINGGYVDEEGIVYKIMRYPDATLVDDSFAGTTYTEKLPNVLAAYSYQVTACYDGKEGGTATSAKVVFGDACDIPYFQDFETPESVDLFTIIDNNKDGKTWKWEESYSSNHMAYSYNMKLPADDWLMTPKLKLKAGIMYKLSYKVCASSSYNAERIKVTMGKEPNVASQTIVLKEAEDVTSYNYETREARFAVNEDGNYTIGFQACSDANKMTLELDDIMVEEIGLSGIPAAVSDLEVIPDPNDELQATIRFTAPSVDFGGNELATLTRIDVYRGDDLENPAYSFESPACGQMCSWVDMEPVLGTNVYSVQAVNEIGVSDMVSAEAFVGCYRPPFQETFDDESALEQYTIIDANKDDNTWTYVADEQCVRYKYKNDAPGDDWLILPAVKFAVGKCKLSFKTWVENEKWPEKLEIMMGTAATVEAQNIVLMEARSLDNTEPEEIVLDFEIGAEGKYYIGFHACSDPKMYQFFVDDIKIEEEVQDGVGSLVDDEVRVYPTIVTDKMTVEAPENARIFVTDLSGRRVCEAAGNAHEIDMSAYAPGWYLVTVCSDNKVVTKKIVKR